MYRALAQDKPLWRALLSSKVGLVVVVTFFCGFLLRASAQIQDVTRPTLTGFSFTPTTIDTSAGPATVTVSISATDDLAGVGGVLTQFDSPMGHAPGTSVSFPPLALSVQGTSDLTFFPFGETGTWKASVVVTDYAGNQRHYSTTELAQLGFPTELVVLGQQEDVTPPVISVSATPKTLWPPNGKMVPVTISGTIKDTEAGVNTSTAAYAVTDEYGLIQPSGHFIILDASGRYSFTIQLQASRNGNDKDGRQYIITVSAKDTAGNTGSAATGVTVPQNQGQ
jgi:hypothetical protein